jgi:branched-chain amino acid transport system ATP-binding protein
VLPQRRRQLAGTLSGGEQQMLAIGRGLMARPRLMLLDEPTLGLAPVMAAQIFELLRTLAASGLTLLLAEQDVNRTLAVAHYGYVIENGRVATQGSAAHLAEDPLIKQAYLGL